MPERNLFAMELPVTLKLNKEFKRAYYRGSYKAGPLLVTYLVKSNRGVRYGITTGKKVGNAVRRNRARRLLRTAFLTLWKENAVPRHPGMDIVFVAREKTPDAKCGDVCRMMRGQLAALTKSKSQQENRRSQ